MLCVLSSDEPLHQSIHNSQPLSVVVGILQCLFGVLNTIL